MIDCLKDIEDKNIDIASVCSYTNKHSKYVMNIQTTCMLECTYYIYIIIIMYVHNYVILILNYYRTEKLL